MLVSHNWLKEFLGENAPDAQKIADLLTFHAFEIEGVEQVDGDTVIDVDVLPNRSSDCLSHRGIAREIATLTNTTLAHDPLASTPQLVPSDAISIEIADTHACPRFSASLISGIKVQPSPQWLQQRLQALGQRPINNIVDATNYVMYALGQPLHAYDADLFPQVDGKWRFGVRFAKEGEKVSLIAESGKDEDRIVEMRGTELLIVDDSSQTPIGLAGVKGGRFAGVHEGSTKILIEAAHFDPVLTRKTARRLGIVIDASKRFENEPSRDLPSYAQQEIIKLILDIAGGTYEGTADLYVEKKENPTVRVRPQKVNALLGLSLSVEEMVSILTRAGITVIDEEDALSCVGPWERTDLNIEADFIEEIGRIYGYDKVQSVLPQKVPLTECNPQHVYSQKVRKVLISLGFSEVITSSFRKKDKIKLRNALASDKGCLRSALHKNILEVLDKNAGFVDLLGAKDTRVFEIGTVFTKREGGGIDEHLSLALGVRIKQSGHTPKDDALLREACSAVENALGVTIEWDIHRGVAETNLSDVIAQLPTPDAYEPVTSSSGVTYEPFSHFQHMTRDIAFWVSQGVTPEEAQQLLRDIAGDLCVRITHVDEFTKDGRTSFAFRLVFQASDRTLTVQEVNTIMDRVYTAAKEQGWETR